MSAALRKRPEPPLGIIASLASGFETVNARLGLILLPLALDLFLWFGPHLSVKPVVDQFLDPRRAPSYMDATTLKNLQALRDGLAAYGASFNLFSVLSTAPLGLPSLMAGRAPLSAPTGQPQVWLVDSPLEYILLFLALGLVGLFFGALYLGGIAQQVRDTRVDMGQLLRQVWGDWAKLTAFVVILVAVVLFVAVPVVLLAALLSLISPLVGSLVSILGSTVILWMLFYAGFTVHGILLKRRGLFGALWDSLRLVQSNLPHTLGLYVVILLLSLGLGALWNIPKDDSWYLLLGAGGHALVSTALVAATFAYYKDRYRWWMEMRQALSAQAEAGQGGVNREARRRD